MPVRRLQRPERTSSRLEALSEDFHRGGTVRARLAREVGAAAVEQPVRILP